MNRNLITFSANEQTLIKTGGINNYASNTVSYIVAEFDLGENWDEFDSVRAIFQSDFETAPAVLAHGSCVVPFEVLRYRSTVRVNLVGSVAEQGVLIDRLTTFPITALNVTADALVDNSIAPISPSEFEEFVAMVKDDADRAEAGAESAESSESAASTSAQSAEDSALSASNSASDASASAQTAQEEAQKITGMVVVVTQLPEGATPTSDWSNGVLTIGIPKGDTGETGATGNGIESAVLNANYTLTLTFTDGTSYTTPSIRGATGATGATGNGISSVTLTSTSGAVKTYTIAFTDGTNTTFDVTDGEVTQAVLDEEITALKSELNNFADTAIVKASGKIVSIVDGANGNYLQKMVMTLPYSASAKTYINARVFGKNWLTITGSTSTINDVTFTVNSDGSVTVNGTASATAEFVIDDLAHNSMYPHDAVYVLSGSPINNDITKYKLRCYVNARDYIDKGSGVMVEHMDYGTTKKVSIVVYAGTTMNNVKFYPMLSLFSQYDGVYEPPKQGEYTVNVTSMNPRMYGGTIDFVTGECVSLYDSAGNLLATPTTYKANVVATGVNLPIQLLDGVTNFTGETSSYYSNGTLDAEYLLNIVGTDNAVKAIKRNIYGLGDLRNFDISEFKACLLQCFDYVAWTTSSGKALRDAVEYVLSVPLYPFPDLSLYFATVKLGNHVSVDYEAGDAWMIDLTNGVWGTRSAVADNKPEKFVIPAGSHVVYTVDMQSFSSAGGGWWASNYKVADSSASGVLSISNRTSAEKVTVDTIIETDQSVGAFFIYFNDEHKVTAEFTVSLVVDGERWI